MPVRDQIEERLTSIFAPARLEIVDESAKHAGHVGARPEGETHFFVTMQAEAFQGKSRVAMHRMVYDALKEELQGPVHALRLDLASSDGQ